MKWDNLTMSQKQALMKIYVNDGVTNLDEIRNHYNRYAEGGPTNEVNLDYPETTVEEEPWAKDYFKNNTNVAGMAIGEGLNGVGGPRRVIINPYSKEINREAVLKNERLRHYFEESNFKLDNVSKAQMNKYKGTPYEGDTLNIGRTEAARYLTGDKHLLSDEQKTQLDSLFNKFDDGGNKNPISKRIVNRVHADGFYGGTDGVGSAIKQFIFNKKGDPEKRLNEIENYYINNEDYIHHTPYEVAKEELSPEEFIKFEQAIQLPMLQQHKDALNIYLGYPQIYNTMEESPYQNIVSKDKKNIPNK